MIRITFKFQIDFAPADAPAWTASHGAPPQSERPPASLGPNAL